MLIWPITFMFSYITREDSICLSCIKACFLLPFMFYLLIIMFSLFVATLAVLIYLSAYKAVLLTWLYGISISYLESFIIVYIKYRIFCNDKDPTDWNRQYRKYSLSIERKIPDPELDITYLEWKKNQLSSALIEKLDQVYSYMSPKSESKKPPTLIDASDIN